LVISVYRELVREKTWSRIHLVPLLLAEGDRDTYRREQAALEREKEIMKDVKGWEVCDAHFRRFDIDDDDMLAIPITYPLSPDTSFET
jgi:hypothetical protein